MEWARERERERERERGLNRPTLVFVLMGQHILK